MDANDLMALKAMSDGTDMSSYEHFMVAEKSAHRPSGTSIASITIGSDALLTGIGAWIFGGVYANAKAKGDDKKMWESTKLLSDAICEKCNITEDEYWHLLKEYYCILAGHHYNENFAEWQIKQMYFIDKNGKRHDSPHWTMEQKIEVYKSIKPKLKYDYNEYDFAVTLEMEFSDNYCMLKEWFPNATEEEMTNKVVDMAINYLNDEDNSSGKIFRYFMSKS